MNQSDEEPYEPDYEQGGKKSNSANQHLPPPPFYSPPQHFPTEAGEQRPPSQQQNGQDSRPFSANSYPLRPCLRVRSESDSQNFEHTPKGQQQQLSIRWHDISGCGELVEVYEYEPSESDYSGDYANGEKSCCSIM